MSKILAIKGDEERGNEVIALLEMLGGDNKEHCQGIELGAYYYIDIRGCITYEDCFIEDELEIFTLDEFYKKYPFKVGDKVVYTKFGDNCDDYPVTIESMEWTGTTIEYTFNDCVTCLAKDLKMWNGEPDTVISGIYLNSCDYADEVELNLGDYEIVVRNGRTFTVKKKPVYPMTYAECCEVLVGRKPNSNEISFDEMELCLVDLDNSRSIDFQNPYLSQHNSIFRLHMCRDAYWKIAGEQMGLGKPWEPNWLDETTKYGIWPYQNTIIKDNAIRTNRMLVFPTPEMRDAFYENFKDLIKSCRELL